MKRYAIALTVLSVASGGTGACSPSPKEHESKAPKAREPVCRVAESARGAWTTLRQPDEVIGFAGVGATHHLSDGDTLSIVGEGALARLERGSIDWMISETNIRSDLSGWVWAASTEHLFVQGGVTHAREYVNSADLMDLTTTQWTRSEPPAAVPVSTFPKGAFWNGEDFVLFETGTDSTDSEERHSYVFGSTFDPLSQSWAPIPRHDVAPVGETGAHDGHVGSVATSRGLFGWGSLLDGSGTYGVQFFEGEWRNLNSNGPGLRRHHHVVGSDEGFFVVGGIHVDSKSEWLYLGEIWHYSLSEDAWTEIDVPDFVDPIRGAWMEGKLYVFGRCDADAVYDPQADSWEFLPPLAVPDWGEPIVAGGRIFLTDVTEPHGDDLLDIFIYDPDASG